MNSHLLPLELELLTILLIYALAVALASPIRRHTNRHRPGLGFLLHHLARPALVLLLTQPVVQLIRYWPAADGFLAANPRHVTAWNSFWIGMLALVLIEAVARKIVALRGREWPLPDLLETILRLILRLTLAFAVLKIELGWDIGPLLASTALATMVLGFALQGVLGNFLAGMSVHLTRTFKQGDWVNVDGIEGRVECTNWRETRIETTSGHEMILPNSRIADAVVHNLNHPTTLRRHQVDVGASYSDAPDVVIAALEAAAAAVSEVLVTPAAEAIVTTFEDYGINYRLRFWTHQFHRRRWVDGQVSRHIWYQFKRQGIEIPFPMSDKLLNDFMAVVYNQRKLDPEPVALDDIVADLMASRLHTEVFGSRLERSDWETLAPLVHRELWTHGETLMHRGETGDHFHVLVSGRLTGSLADGVTFDEEPGAVVGSMSLLTGKPRAATFTTATSCELLTFDRDAFIALLGLHEEIPERLANLAAARAEGYREAAARRQADPGGPDTVEHDKAGVLQRLLGLLGR